MPNSETSLNELLHEIKRIAQHREKLSEDKIAAIYRTLSKDIKSFLADEYIKYADEEGRLFVSYLDAQNAKAKFLNEIAKNVDSISPQVKAEILEYVDDTYDKSYKGMIEALKKADKAGILAEVGVDLAVNENVLKQAINNNIAKLTLPAVMAKHRAEIIYQIQQELNIGLMRGDRYETMTKRIAERIGVSEGKAKNIVRTETHRNVESGFMDCAEHIQEGVEGSEYIYAGTWRTMKDDRVRPQVMRKTKRGWVKSWRMNGADHVKMEGVTVKVGEKFNLGGGVTAKAPSQSGVAAHDCQCRCFVEYNLMTVEEFAKATGLTVEKVREKYNMVREAMSKENRDLMNDSGIVDLKLQETVEATRFDAAIQAAKAANKNGACVDTHPMKELRSFKTFLSKDDMAGVAVKPDGDITAVFKNSNSQAKGAVNDLIITARANGGTKMDCYGRFLVNSYEKCGYVPVARVPFNADYVSDQFLLDNPMDVYVMMKNTDTIETVIKKNAAKAYSLSTQEMLDNLPTYIDYDEALSFRDGLLAALND